MGLDSNLYVPAEVRLRDFVDVLSILLGAEVALEPLPQARGAHHAVVKNGLKYRATSIPEMLVIEGVIDGHQVDSTWHWESDGGPIPGARLFHCATKAGRREVLEALADVFGGALDFNDCDSIDIDHFGSLRNATYRTGANDGEGWEAWQAKMASLTKVPHMWGFNKDEEPSEPWLGQVRHG